MRHAADADELFEVLGDKLRPVVRDDPRLCIGKFLLCPLQDDFHIRLGHRLADVPVHDVSAEAIQDAAQIVKRAADVEVRNVDMPVFVRL